MQSTLLLIRLLTNKQAIHNQSKQLFDYFFFALLKLYNCLKANFKSRHKKYHNYKST